MNSQRDPHVAGDDDPGAVNTRLDSSMAFGAASESYRRAVEEDPRDAKARNNLAVVLCLAGEYQAALTHVQRAVELEPDFVDAYVNGSVIAANLFGHQASLRWLEAALSKDPGHNAARLLRASVLAALGRAAEALRECRRMAALAPGNAQVFEIAAEAFRANRQYDDALEAYEHAQALSSSGMLGVRKAMLLLERGRSADSLAELQRVLAADPELVPAWYALGLASDFRLDDHAVQTLERIARTTRGLTFTERLHLRFTLGRAYLERGRDEAAFAYLDAGNTMKHRAIDYDVRVDERIMRDLAERAGALERQAAEEQGDVSELPVFVVGMPRSGTTLVEQIIAAHPQAFGAGELASVAMLSKAGGALARGRPLELGRRYVAEVTSLAPRARRIVDKMPLNFLHLDTIRRILPRARIVHCRRDPIDTCLSCYVTLFDKSMGFCYDQEDLGRFYLAYERLMEAWSAVLPRDRFIEVDYEDVIDDLEGQARRLIAFCGLPWDDRCLRFYENEGVVRSASLTQVRRPIYRTSVGRAQRYAPRLQRLVTVLDSGRTRRVRGIAAANASAVLSRL